MFRVLEHTEHTALAFSSEHQETKTLVWCAVGICYYWDILGIFAQFCQGFFWEFLNSRIFFLVGACYVNFLHH